MARVTRQNYRARRPQSWTSKPSRPDTDQLEQLREHLARIDAKLRARRAERAA